MTRMIRRTLSKRPSVEEEIKNLPTEMTVIEVAAHIHSYPESVQKTLEMEGIAVPSKRAKLKTLDIFTALHAHQEQGHKAFQEYLDAHVKI